MNNKRIHILVAEDDPDDCLLMKEAFRECSIQSHLHFVHDGEELLDYLMHRDPFLDEKKYPKPGLILLDLNMPRLGGREALGIIKADPNLKVIPVVVFSTSCAEEDISHSYESGVNAFISKPITYSGLVEVVRMLGRHWLDIVNLPIQEKGE
ncbi:response regulator [Stutzerimonas stutzeri]|nr:response regulator [Stutzerimonas stutzeri]